MNDRELDRLVAEKVMRLPKVRPLAGYLAWGEKKNDVPWYSTDMTAAWLVVDRLRWIGLRMDICDCPAEYDSPDHWSVRVSTAASKTPIASSNDVLCSRAICYAAL